jgi:hypothetical protein
MPTPSVERIYQHRDAGKILASAAATGPPIHASFAAVNGKIRPAHQASQTHGHPRTVRVIAESALPTQPFSSSEQHVLFQLPALEGALEDCILDVEFTVRHTTGSNRKFRMHPAYSIIDRVEVFFEGNTAEETVSGEAQMLEYIYSVPNEQKVATAHDIGFATDETGNGRANIDGRIRSDDLLDEVDLATGTDRTQKFRIPLKTCLSHSRICTAFLNQPVRIKVYFSGTLPCTFKSTATGTSATLSKCDLLCVESCFDSDTLASISKLYQSSTGVTVATIARSESEHVIPAGSAGTEQTTVLNQHTSYCAGACAYWIDSAKGLTVDSDANAMKVFPFNGLTVSNNAAYRIEDEMGKDILQKVDHEEQRNINFSHCNFPLAAIDYRDQYVFLPHSYDLQGSLEHGLRQGGLAYNADGRWKFVLNRGTSHNVATLTFKYITFCYADLEIKNGRVKLHRL